MFGSGYAISALSIIGVIGVVAQDTSCVEGCITGTRNRFAEFSCVDATQAGCLCVSDNFKFSVRDCSLQTCQANEDQAFDYMFSSFCNGFGPPEESEAASTSEVQSTSEVASTSEPASTTAEEPTTTSEEAESTTVASEAASSTEEVSTTAESASSTVISSSATATTAAASSDQTSSTTEAQPTSTSSQDEEENEGDEAAGGGLSQGAKVGIGVGVAVIVVAIAVVAAVFLLRRKRSQQPPAQSNDISRPMPPPGTARSYPSMDNGGGAWGEKGRGGESIEMHTNRYEDMPPSQTPRVMV